jgi:hypothetical protein
MRPILGALPVALALLLSAQPQKPKEARKRGTARAEVTRPDHFPHRIWAACDFECQTPDYAWFGPKETEQFPKRVIFLAAFDTGTDAKSKAKYWPGEFEIVTSTSGAPADSYWGVARAVPHRETKGKWIRLQLQPDRVVGAHTKLRFRYHLSGASEMTVQLFDVTDQDNRHIHVKGLEQGRWQWAILDFTRDSTRNDGKETKLAAGHKVDDIFFFVKPAEGKDVNLHIDEGTLFDAGTAPNSSPRR